MSTTDERKPNSDPLGASPLDEELPPDPLAGTLPGDQPSAPRSGQKAEPKGEGKAEGKGEGKGEQKGEHGKKNQVVRILHLGHDVVEVEDDVDPDTVISLYMPRRRSRKIGALLLRMDRLRLALLAAVLLVLSLFALAFMQEHMGQFTINLNRLELYRKGIAISEDRAFSDPTARLSAGTVKDATNITESYLPEVLDGVDGDHNGRNYLAYTYYVRNAGKEDVGYIASIVLENASKGAENAVRVAVWQNGVRTIYAEPAADGSPEPGCTSFLSHKLVCTYHVPEFLVGYVNRYTVVIWLEGEDPECIDEIVGGSIQFSMNIDADTEDDTSLLTKFVQDIRDTLTGDRPISAAGTDAPDYYLTNTINWHNRRNMDYD